MRFSPVDSSTLAAADALLADRVTQDSALELKSPPKISQTNLWKVQLTTLYVHNLCYLIIFRSMTDQGCLVDPNAHSRDLLVSVHAHSRLEFEI